MSGLYYYRRHLKTCKRRGRGRKELSCTCPIWVDGMLNGKRYNRSLDTRNLTRAAAMIEEIQSPNYREPKLLAEAIAAFQTAQQDLSSGTQRNYHRVLAHLLTTATAHRVIAMPHVTVELIDRYRETRPICAQTWVKELAALRTFFRFGMARKWTQENPAAAVKAPKIKPTEKTPYSSDDISRFLAAAEKLGRTPYERLRARAWVLLLRFTAMRISDVALLERARVRDGQIFVRATKNGKLIFLPLTPDLLDALEHLPRPRAAGSDNKYFFWSGNGSRRAAIRDTERTMRRVYQISGVPGAHNHRFRHTLATELLEAGATFDEVGDILGSSPAIIRKHYAQWSSGRQERISNLLQTVFPATYLRQAEKESVSTDIKEQKLVDGMGFEPTTPALRTLCSPS